MVAIVGPSGSDKSVIMNMITGIDRPSVLAPLHRAVRFKPGVALRYA